MVTEIKALKFVGSQGTFHVEFAIFSPYDYIRELLCSLLLVHDVLYGKCLVLFYLRLDGTVCGCSVLKSTTSKP